MVGTLLIKHTATSASLWMNKLTPVAVHVTILLFFVIFNVIHLVMQQHSSNLKLETSKEKKTELTENMAYRQDSNCRLPDFNELLSCSPDRC